MSWICSRCETENPDKLKVCEVCDSPRESSPMNLIKEELKEKYTDAAYNSFIRYHYVILDAADKGDVNAQYKVAEWFNRAAIVDSSNEYSKIAANWYKKAAIKGHVDAQIKLAFCYEEGRGVPQIKDEALKWYKRAASEGDNNALLKYLKIKYNSKTYDSIIKYRPALLWSADEGHLKSQYEMGEWFRTHKNQSTYREEAVKWYAKAAKKGHGEAMYKLGECYETGFGVYANLDEALNWYNKAAKASNKSAYFKLAQSYLYGWKGKKNVVLALKWFARYDNDISAFDLYAIGWAFDKGDTVPVNKEKAVKYYERAAAKGNIDAQYSLGVCYENGNGVERDVLTAKQWYEKAAMHGHSQAQQCINRMNSQIQKVREKEWEDKNGKGKEKKKEKTIAYLFLVPIWSLLWYACFKEGVPILDIYIPQVWPNEYPTNIIMSLILGYISQNIFYYLFNTDTN